MRNLLVIAALGVAAFMAGWFQIHREGDETTIRINRAEIRSDARRAIDRGKDFLDRREQDSLDRQDDRYTGDDRFRDGRFDRDYRPAGYSDGYGDRRSTESYPSDSGFRDDRRGFGSRTWDDRVSDQPGRGVDRRY